MAEMNFKKIIISFLFSPLIHAPIHAVNSAVPFPAPTPPLAIHLSHAPSIAPVQQLQRSSNKPIDATKRALEVAFNEHRLPSVAPAERTEPDANARAGRLLPQNSGW